MLGPGHKGEVFCLAAEEARELVHSNRYHRLRLFMSASYIIRQDYIAKNIDEFIITHTNC